MNRIDENLRFQVDELVSGFIQQATDWRSLAAMTAGGMTCRLGRMGAMAAGTGRLASLGIGLSAEVTAFEMTNRSFMMVGANGRLPLPPNLWRWEGQGGIRQGLLSSLITFGSLKGAGRLAQGENVVVQHLLQDTGMVLGHQVSAAFGITPRPTGSLAEQFLHAEATNLQLSAGMALAHSFAPGIQGIERGLDLSLRTTDVGANLVFAQNGGRSYPMVHKQGSPLQNELQPAFATAEAAFPRPPKIDSPPRDHLVFSLGGPKDGQEGSLPSLPDVEAWRMQIQERHEATRGILGESLNQILDSLRRRPIQIKDPAAILESLRRVEEIQNLESQELLKLAACLRRAKEQGLVLQGLADRFLEDLEWRCSRIYRTREQIAFSLRVLSGPASTADLNELRRRLEWVLSTPEFQRPFNWERTPAAVSPAGSVRSLSERYEKGKTLLLRFHPHPTQVDFQLFTRVAQGPIRGREIAFDLDETLGDGLIRPKAEEAARLNPNRYDVGFEHFVHQYVRMRLPYRNMQALLLGLWAAENRLKVATASDNVPNNLEAFFNDFPLLKIAFGFTTPEDPFRILTPMDLHMHPHFMDLLKREKFHHRHFETPEGRAFLRRIQMERGLDALPFLLESKFPFPDFRFDVLVDDKERYAHEMQLLGFGCRWIPAQKTGEMMFQALLGFYSRSRPETAEFLERWLASDPDEETRSDSIVVSLAARQARLQSSPALQRIREALAEWGKDLHVSEFKKEWRELEFRLNRRDPNVAELLSRLIDSHPLVAKVLLQKLGLVARDSVFASDPVVHQALFLKAEDTILPDVFDSKAHVIWKRFLTEPFQRTPPETLRLASLSKKEREARLGRLPNVIFEVLSDPALEKDLFIFLAEQWELGRR